MQVKNIKKGRPTNYKKGYTKQAFQFALLGATDVEMSAFFEVSEKTFNTWKKQFPEFLQSIKKGKAIADAEVAMKLFKRANGYKYDEVSYEKMLTDSNDKENIKTDLYKKKIVTKEVAPDVTAQIFWLKNRQKDKWKDRHHNSIDIDFEKLSDADLDRILDQLKSVK